MGAPYVPQDVAQVSKMVEALEAASKAKKKSAFSCKKMSFRIKDSRDGLTVDSWKMSDWDYKRRDLPTYARGLFTTKTHRNQPEIVVRGYDKFFNVGEVHATEWDNILTRTQPPYELTLKENGCIIFISGMQDETLLVCSKHSTGDRSDIAVSHASAGELLLEKQLISLGKTRTDLARELYSRNITAVAELCDDNFEEHILAYGPDKSGLYLHGINLNVPQFTTYPSHFVQVFAETWGFVKTGLITMTDIQEVKTFLEGVAETGAHDGRDVEGFVIRCRMSHDPDTQPYQDWFFKYKFEEPYLMYRQWRECTKSLIAGHHPRIKKHRKITEEYLLYARMRLAQDSRLAKLYNKNHGIIALREQFLAYKGTKGIDAAAMEEEFRPGMDPSVTADVVITPIATIGCGKTTLAVAMTHLFGWGHVQNDNIPGKQRPPKFIKAVMEELTKAPAVVADRNNTARRERDQLIKDLKARNKQIKLVCLNFEHDEDAIEDIRHVTRERIIARGDNHQTIHATSDRDKFLEVMNGFIDRFEACSPHFPPDNGFDLMINLDPLVGSRANLEKAVNDLQRAYPKLMKESPTSKQLDSAIEIALGYKPDYRQTIPGRPRNGKAEGQVTQSHPEPPALEYMAIDVPSKDIIDFLEDAFGGVEPRVSRLYKQLKQTRRVQSSFHVTLIHRASAEQHRSLWARYHNLWLQGGSDNSALGECDVILERIIFDDRIMAIVVRLVDKNCEWICVNDVAHITVGTRDQSVKPKESNTLLAQWLANGITESIHGLVFESKPAIKGTVKGVLSRY